MTVPPWRHDGAALVREWSFRDFETALAFVEQVSQEAVDHLRRPVPSAHEVFEVSRKPLHDPVEEAQRRDDLRRLVEDVGRLGGVWHDTVLIERRAAAR